MDREPPVTGDAPGGVHLSDKQVVFGVMAASMVVIVSFLCGVFVGRGVQAARPAPAAVGAAAPTIVADPELPASLAPTEPGASLPPDPLSYPDRLNRSEPVPESLKPAAPPQPPPEAAASEARGPRVDAPKASATRGAEPATPAASPRADSPLTVQVAAVRRRAEAQAIVDRLVKKGFPAYVFSPPGGDRTGGFRVRVGSYKTRAEAEAMAQRLTKEEQYKPWITR